MQVNDTIAMYVEELIGKLGTKKGKKGKNQVEKTTLSTPQANPAYNLSLSGKLPPPIWSNIRTKSEPAMTDEEFENAIKALAVEFAEKSLEIGNSGKSSSMINKELFNFTQSFINGKYAELENQYVSVVSPDRKAAYANANFKDSNKVYGNEVSYRGDNELMHWNPSLGWATVTTVAEEERTGKFTRLFIDTLKAYEAEHGVKIPYSTISKEVTPINHYA